MVERFLPMMTKANGNGKAISGGQRAGLMGRGLVAPTPRVKAMTSMGVSGVSVISGYVRSNERNTDWIGTKKWQTIADLSVNVSIVAASVGFFLNMVAHPKWTVKPAEDQGKGKSSAEAEKLADFMNEVIDDMTTPWQRVVRRCAMYRFNGFGIQEWIAKKRDDGKIGIQDIEPRPAFTIERWSIDDDGTILGVWQRSPQTFELLGLPRGKLIYIVDDTYTDQPDGIGVYRMLAEPFSRLKQYLELEARAYERDMRGIPVGRAPVTVIKQMVKDGRLTQVEAEALLQGLRDFITTQVRDKNTSILMDSMPYENQTADGLTIAGTQQWDVNLLSGGVSGLSEMATAIDRLQREMARIIGTEHLMMGDQGGNRALSEDKSRNLYLIANAVLANIADAMTHDLIDPVWSLNGFDPKLKPTFTTEDVAFKNAQEIATALQAMAAAGAVLAPNDPAIDDVRDLLGISKAPEPTPDQMGLMGIGPKAPAALAAANGPPGAKKPPTAAPGRPGATNGKQPGRSSPPQTDDAKQQQVADNQNQNPDKKKPVNKYADDDADDLDKFNPWHDLRGLFSSGPGGGSGGAPVDLARFSQMTREQQTKIIADLQTKLKPETSPDTSTDQGELPLHDKPVALTSTEAPAVVSRWTRARSATQALAESIKEQVVESGISTPREAVVAAAIEGVIWATMPELAFPLHMVAVGALTRPISKLATKLGITEENIKRGLIAGTHKLMQMRRTQLTMGRFAELPSGAVADVTTGRVLTKLDDEGNLVIKADPTHADDAVLAWLQSLLDALNAYQPQRDPATLDAADATVHQNRLHEVVDDTAKFNPNHDDQGRFAEGDGSGGGGYIVTSKGGLAGYTPQPANSASELYQRTYQAMTPQEAMTLAGPDVAEKAAEAERRSAAQPNTQSRYLKDGKYTSERQALHTDILRHGGLDRNGKPTQWTGFTAEAVAKATPPEGEQPTLYVLGGRGGAGKSWFSKSPDSPFDASKTLYINSDNFKESLPEYQGWNAGQVHGESSDLANLAHDRARALGLNVTFDATLASDRTSLVHDYEKAGYRIEGYFMHTAPQVSAVRALGRFDKTGRYVRPSIILNSTNNERSFDTMTPHFAKWRVYDNNSGLGPVLVASKKDAD